MLMVIGMVMVMVVVRGGGDGNEEGGSPYTLSRYARVYASSWVLRRKASNSLVPRLRGGVSVWEVRVGQPSLCSQVLLLPCCIPPLLALAVFTWVLTTTSDVENVPRGPGGSGGWSEGRSCTCWVTKIP